MNLIVSVNLHGNFSKHLFFIIHLLPTNCMLINKSAAVKCFSTFINTSFYYLKHTLNNVQEENVCIHNFTQH